YASVGQDEEKLQEKIVDLLRAGTRYVWVVRLVGARRVEVYEPNKAPITYGPGQLLSAPNILKNDVPVEALYDRTAAHEHTLRNLLQRRGYESLDQVHEEGREAGAVSAAQRALRAVLSARGLALAPADEERIETCTDTTTLFAWAGRAA